MRNYIRCGSPKSNDSEAPPPEKTPVAVKNHALDAPMGKEMKKEQLRKHASVRGPTLVEANARPRSRSFCAEPGRQPEASGKEG